MEDQAQPVAATDFGILLRTHRASTGLTQEELAARAGISTRGVSDLERGIIRAPQRYTLERLATALGLAPEARAAFAEAARRARTRAAPTVPIDPPRPELPLPLTALIGREREVDAVAALVREPAARLLTLLGPPGIGKTRLGLEVAALASADFPAGVLFVALAPLTEPALALSAIARAVGVREGVGVSLLATVKARLREGRRLLVLDNFEQILAAAPLVAELLAACPALAVLVTSRAPLRLRGEREFVIPPLALPPPRDLPAPDDLVGYAAVELFAQRARDVDARFALTARNAHLIAAICQRLEGLPLAIELAAARSKLLPFPTLLERLNRRLDVLTGGPRDLPTRQQTLRGAIAWSYALLDPDEQALFRRLAAFVGGCTLDAAEAVCGVWEIANDRLNVGPPVGTEDERGHSSIASAHSSILDGLASLLDKSLLGRGADDAAPRFTMLETIREYALEQLVACGELEHCRSRHLAHFVALVERADPELRGPQQGAWLARLEEDHDNLRAALRCALDRGEAETSLRLVGVLVHFWYVRGYVSEGRAWFDAALALKLPGESAAAVADLRLAALRKAGLLAAQQGDYDRATLLTEEALIGLRERGAQPDIGAALNVLGNIAGDRGQFARAESLYAEALAAFRAADHGRGIAIMLNNLGTLAARRGDHGRAVALHEESLAIKQRLGDQRGIAGSLTNLGEAAVVGGDARRAAGFYTRALALWRELGDKRGSGIALVSLGETVGALGDPSRAVTLIEEGLALLREVGDMATMALALAYLGVLAVDGAEVRRAETLFGESLAISVQADDRLVWASDLEGLAYVAVLRGEAPRATQLLAVADTLRTTLGLPLTALYRPRHDHALATLRDILGVAAFDAAWAAGRSLPPDQAVASALDRTGRPTPDQA